MIILIERLTMPHLNLPHRTQTLWQAGIIEIVLIHIIILMEKLIFILAYYAKYISDSLASWNK